MAWALLSIMEQPRFHTEEPAQRVWMGVNPFKKRQPGSVKLNQNDAILVLTAQNFWLIIKVYGVSKRYNNKW
ncbi:hypothetical protein Lspi_2849 [Legionella spiritensis]|uniref:Uncharacterized protein n=2 Tax=Legionella spiritensis TaxID=452 RepID=A0A0W0YWE9_LEGSP|nr:hypothetical protein Lspi_2849 [Legionella spiritensis]SNV28069.1 Uncharacterised protein [Legionella spiritensis]